MGLYSINAAEMFEQHTVPQDNGNRSDVRWLAITSDNNNIGIFASMNEPFNVSMYNYDDENLTAAERIHALTPIKEFTVNLD